MTRPPSAGIFTSRYGRRRNPITGRLETHHGLDINSAEGLTLVAPERSQLVAYGVVPGWEVHGRVAQLQGESGALHWLSHTARLVLGRDVGDWLDEDDPVAVMGLTGQTDGLHVHWETRYHGQRLDPEGWLAATATHPPTPAPTPEKEDEDMAKNSAFIYTRSADQATVVLLANTSAGWWMEYISNGHIVPKGNNAVAATLDTGSYAEVSEAFANAMKASLPRAQGVQVSGELTIAGDTD